jgi:hypothetical protein
MRVQGARALSYEWVSVEGAVLDRFTIEKA